MTRFQYLAMTFDGREAAGEAEARDTAGLGNALGARGLVLIEANPVRSGDGWKGWLALPAHPREVTSLLSELALMLQSGQPIDEALGLLGDGIAGSLGRVVRAVRAALLRGTSFVDALAEHGEIFPAEVIALVRVAESTGRLDRAIEAAAQQRVRTQALSEKIIGALQYPAFLMLAAAGVLVFFLLYVIPQFADIIKDAGSRGGGSLSNIFTASELLRTHLDVFLEGFIGVLAAGLFASRSRSFRRVLSRGVGRLPVIRGVGELRRSTLFCMNLGTLLGQGVPMPEALKVLEAVLGGDAAEGLSRIGDSVRRGGSLAEALESSAFLPKIARRMLKIGEESGELAEIAARAGALYEKKLDQRLNQIAALIGPIATMVIAGLIGGLMVTIMSALATVNQLVL